MNKNEIIDLLTKTMNEAEDNAEKYPYMKEWYEGRAAGLAIAINALCELK